MIEKRPLKFHNLRSFESFRDGPQAIIQQWASWGVKYRTKILDLGGTRHKDYEYYRNRRTVNKDPATEPDYGMDVADFKFIQNQWDFFFCRNLIGYLMPDEFNFLCERIPKGSMFGIMQICHDESQAEMKRQHAISSTKPVRWLMSSQDLIKIFVQHFEIMEVKSLTYIVPNEWHKKQGSLLELPEHGETLFSVLGKKV